MKFYAYAGRILRVDLDRMKTFTQPLPGEMALKFIGGAGFIAKTLWDETGPDTEPFSPENRFILAVGPFTGTSWPQSGRFQVGARSPLTGVFGDSSCCGFLGPELKLAGYDMIVISGRASNPVYIYIDDDNVEIRDAKGLWGLKTSEAEKALKEEVGDWSCQAAVIGPAAENLVRYSGIFHDTRVAARAGIGAVLGSKKVKGIVVRGSKDVRVAYPDKFQELVDKLSEEYLRDPHIMRRRKYGTPILAELMNEIARWPVKNFQRGMFPNVERIGGERLRSEYRIKDRGCYACLCLCEKPVLIRKGQFKGVYKNPEYETISSLGPRCYVGDLEAIIYMNYLCNEYGMDTISTGGTIAWAMECYEKGIITREDTGDLELYWGDYDTMIKLIEMIAYRKGFGDLLAEGSRRASRKIGRGSEKYVMAVKGMEIPAQDGRAQKSMGLAHVTATRGADHLKAFPILDESIWENKIIVRYGREYLPELGERLNPKYKPFLVKDCEELAALCDSLLLCKSTGTLLPLESGAVYYPEIAMGYSLAVGIQVSAEDIRLAGERIYNLERAYNQRLGLSRKDDRLPERFTKVPSPEGPAKGQVVELDQMLDEYYKLRGWDPKTGMVTREKLEQLGLKDVADELERLGKLPG